MQKIKALIILIFGSFMIMTAIVPTASLALDCANPISSKDQLQCGACGGSGIEQAQCATAPTESTKSLNGTIKNVINILSAVAGVVVVIMIIAAGFRYITGAGNDQSVAGAKRTLIWAITGIVIVALAQVIARFVLAKSTGS